MRTRSGLKRSTLSASASRTVGCRSFPGRAASRGDASLHPRIARRLMAEVTTSGKRHDPAADLTAREMEVLQLIAQGRSNAEIAAELFITERTVKAHVSNLLSKLHLSDRTQAAVYAWREGLIEK